MENWIGVGIWIVMGGLLGLVAKVLIRQSSVTPGHDGILVVLGALGGVVGGMLGVGIFSFREPLAMSPGGMAGAALLALSFSAIYRWGVRGLI